MPTFTYLRIGSWNCWSIKSTSPRLRCNQLSKQNRLRQLWQGDLVPHLARSQFRPKSAFPAEVLQCAISPQSLAMGMSASSTSSSSGSGSSTSGVEGNSCDDLFAGEQSMFLRCYAHVLRPNVGFCCRANTLANYGYMNRVVRCMSSWLVECPL